MGSFLQIFQHPDELYPMVKLRLAMRKAEKQIPAEAHWGFCYSLLHKLSTSFALVIQQLDTDLRDAVCVFYLVLRALDTVEDDTSIATGVKVPILVAFHHHVYDTEWHFSCGTKDYKVLMDEFYHVQTAFLELGRGYQEIIEDTTMRMGAGMAKFICQEVETVDDYNEYCGYVAGLVGLGLSKLFHASGKEYLAPDTLSNSMGLFLQKTNIIRDYLEDINEIPKSRMFWPREIWSKYVNKLEELKYEENSVKAVQCLNDMVTNALLHAEDCLKYMSTLQDPSIFRFWAIPQIMAIGTLALCYNNLQVFRGVVKMRRGLTAKLIGETKTMSEVYGAFYDFLSMLKSKVDEADPNARKTKDHIEVILRTCRDSGTLSKRNSYIIQSKPQYSATWIVFIFMLLAILLAYSSSTRAPNTYCGVGLLGSPPSSSPTHSGLYDSSISDWYMNTDASAHMTSSQANLEQAAPYTGSCRHDLYSVCSHPISAAAKSTMGAANIDYAPIISSAQIFQARLRILSPLLRRLRWNNTLAILLHLVVRPAKNI